MLAFPTSEHIGHESVLYLAMRYFIFVAGLVLAANVANVASAATVPSMQTLRVVEFTGGVPNWGHGPFHGTLKFRDRLDGERYSSYGNSHRISSFRAIDPIASLDFRWRYTQAEMQQAVIRGDSLWHMGSQNNALSFTFDNVNTDFIFADRGRKKLETLTLTFFGGFPDAGYTLTWGWIPQENYAFANLTPESVYATELKLGFDDGTTVNGNLGRYDNVGTELAPVPLPAGVVLLGSALAGLIGFRGVRRRPAQGGEADAGVAESA